MLLRVSCSRVPPSPPCSELIVWPASGISSAANTATPITVKHDKPKFAELNTVVELDGTPQSTPVPGDAAAHMHSDSDISCIQLDSLKFDADDVAAAARHHSGQSGDESFVITAPPRHSTSSKRPSAAKAAFAKSGTGSSATQAPGFQQTPVGRTTSATAPPSTSSESFMDLAFSGTDEGTVPAYLRPMIGGDGQQQQQQQHRDSRSTATPLVIATPIHNPLRTFAVTDASTDMSAVSGAEPLPFVVPNIATTTDASEDAESDASVWPSTYSEDAAAAGGSASGWGSSWLAAEGVTPVDGVYSYHSPGGESAYSAYSGYTEGDYSQQGQGSEYYGTGWEGYYDQSGTAAQAHTGAEGDYSSYALAGGVFVGPWVPPSIVRCRSVWCCGQVVLVAG